MVEIDEIGKSRFGVSQKHVIFKENSMELIHFCKTFVNITKNAKNPFFGNFPKITATILILFLIIFSEFISTKLE
jgi:hypothetical protein